MMQSNTFFSTYASIFRKNAVSLSPLFKILIFNTDVMKKFLFLSTMLLVALMAQAQSLKVCPKMKKGDVKTYVTVTQTNAAGTEVKLTETATYTVTEETAAGYVIDVVVNNCTTDAAADNLMGRLLTASSEMMKGVTLRLTTDKDGQIVGIKNFDEVKKATQERAGLFFDELLKSAPQMADVMPKEVLMKQVAGQLTEGYMVNAAKLSNSPLALNGKTVVIGAQDEYTNDQGMKMKRMYFLAGNNKVTTTSTMNMSKEEMKQLIIDKVSEMAPDQADMVKQNIDMVMASGMMKLEATEKANYELDANGWVKSITVENETNSMGQKVKINATVTLQ